MLKRSPKSKISTAFSTLIVLIAICLGTDALLSFYRMQNSYGIRKDFLFTKSPISSGSILKIEDLERKSLFTLDAPTNAIEANSFEQGRYSKIDIPAGVFVSSSMISETAVETIENENRIMFVPTKDKIDSSISTHADLLYVAPDGFGSETIATNAKIHFDLSENTEDDDIQNQHEGYFVEITELEAEELTVALASGEVRFAMIKKPD